MVVHDLVDDDFVPKRKRVRLAGCFPGRVEPWGIWLCYHPRPRPFLNFRAIDQTAIGSEKEQSFPGLNGKTNLVRHQREEGTGGNGVRIKLKTRSAAGKETQSGQGHWNRTVIHEL